jgi:hypothetical protein
VHQRQQQLVVIKQQLSVAVRVRVVFGACGHRRFDYQSPA